MILLNTKSEPPLLHIDSKTCSLHILLLASKKQRKSRQYKRKKGRARSRSAWYFIRQHTYYVLTQSFIMPTYTVHVIIENKPNISDPEGDTILNDLVLKGDNPSVKKIRAGKILKFTVEATDKKKAEKTVEGICQELRIFNPLVSNVIIESKTI